MDTNQNNQLLHTFEKGMDTDTSDAWLESGKYRYALNLRYLTDIGNDTGELHSIEGWVSTDINSFNVSPYPAGAFKSYGEPVQYREYCTEGSPELYYMKTAPGIEEFDVQGRTFGHGNLCCYQGIVYVCIVEEGEIASDQFDSDEWRSVHLADLVDMGYMDYKGYDVGSTILAATGIRDLGIYVVKDIFNRWFVFKQQKDDQSTTKVFGPCIESIGDGYENKLSLVTRWESDDNAKLYIADGQHELMVINLFPDVIYTTIESITNTTSSHLSKPEVHEYSPRLSGMLNPAIIQYSYRLYKKNQTASVISQISSPITIDLIKNNITYGIPQGKHSSMGASISIDTSNVSNKYDKIILYRITYEVNGLEPTIDIVYDGDLISYDNKFTFDDDGSSSISTITTAEYNSYDGINIIPKIIESKEDYLFASNIKYIQPEFFKDWDARSYTTGNYYTENGTDINILSLSHLDTVPLDATIKHTNWSLSTDYDDSAWLNHDNVAGRGTGLNIDWEFIIKEKELDRVIYQPGIHQYAYDTTKSLQRGEIYRYAIVLYNKDGYKSEAKWIADIRIPDQSAKAGSFPVNPSDIVMYHIKNPFKWKTDNGDQTLFAYNVGIKFTISNLPQDCIGYEIVRAKRTINDRHIVSQGAVSKTVAPRETDHDEYIDYRMPTGFITFDSMTFVGDSDSDSDIITSNIIKGENDELLFFSPEVVYQGDDITNIMSSYNTNLKLLKWVHPLSTDTPPNIINSTNLTWPGVYINPSVMTDTTTYDAGAYFRIYQRATGNEYYKLWLRYNCNETYGLKLDYSAAGTTYTDRQLHVYKLNSDKNTSDINSTFIASKDAYSPICYIKLYNKFDFDISLVSPEIENYKLLESKQYNDFADSEGNIQILNHNVSIGNRTVNLWISPSIYKQSQLSNAKSKLSTNSFSRDNAYSDSIIGISGKSLILKSSYLNDEDQNNLFFLYINHIDDSTNRDYKTFFGTFVCNIIKYVNPYGGQENSAKINNQYISYGNYADNTQSSIDIYDGDCNLVCFECTTMHDWYHPTLNKHMNMNVVYSIPLETVIDVERDYGDRYSKLNANSTTINRNLNFLLAEATNFRGWFNQTKPMYLYNTAYSILPFVQFYTGMSKEEYEDNKYDYRVHYSNQKTNNEQIDSWTLFKSANYLDVDTRYGKITNLRLFKDRLLFWLNEAVGVLSVNERTILQDLNDYNIILGNGDVLQRYDYITTEYGMKPDQYADGQSNTCLYWWDGYKNEILAYAGEGVVPTGRTNSIHSYLCDAAIEENNPTLAYDDKYNEMLFSLNNYQSLVFNEVIKAYTGIYTIAFKNKVNFVDKLLLCDYDDKVNIWNQHHNNEDYMPSMLLYVVNANPTYTKVYDDMLFECTPDPYGDTDSPKLEFEFNTPLKLRGKINEVTSTNCSKRERDFRMRIPRAEIYEESVWKEATVGERLRGKTMKCKLTSTTKQRPLSLQYIITKFRISWS